MSQFWLVLANSSKARFFEGASPVGSLNEIFELENETAQMREQDLVSDRPGRRSDDGYAQRSAMPRDAMEAEHNAFVRDIVRFLEKHRIAGDFETVSIVAEPQILGKLRNEMPPALRALVLEEVAKNVADRDPGEVQSHLHVLH